MEGAQTQVMQSSVLLETALENIMPYFARSIHVHCDVENSSVATVSPMGRTVAAIVDLKLI